MKNRISVRFLEKYDVVRFNHKSEGTVTGIVNRTYQSGGKYGAHVVAVLDGPASADIHIKEGQILELLWREEKEAK